VTAVRTPGGIRRVSRTNRTIASVALAFTLVAVTAACSSRGTSSTDQGSGDSSATTQPASVAPLPGLSAIRGTDARVVDDKGRQVLLRGVNLNVLGDYFQANAKYPTVIPATDADWAEMAADGFNVVRLLVSWSALEPTKGAFDTAYVARIHDAVNAAKAHGIYVVLDMHQDAYGKFVASPVGTTCPDPAKPGIGWDGAPEWATITGGADTCAAVGVRELAPAVMKAFDNFYADTDGIQTELTKTWASLAGEFATEPAIAGYDLFNEPNWGSDADSSGAKLGAFTQKTIAAIRSAETAAGGTSHIAFFEPVVLWPKQGTLPPVASISDPNVVFAPHGYNDSIQGGTIAEGFASAAASAATYGTTFWIGEYGWFGNPAEDAAKVTQYAAQEDQYRVGGAWWQWKQACGDPHSVGARDAEPPPALVHLHHTTCPGDVNGGPVTEFVTILSRAYPRFAPGQLTSLTSDPATGEFSISGAATSADGGSDLDVWIPDGGRGKPTLSGCGLGPIDIQTVDGGYRATAAVQGPKYAMTGGATTTGSTLTC